MKTISFKIDDAIFKETENMMTYMKKTQNRYINEALNYYNKVQKRKILQQKLKNESLLVREDSMSVLKEFDGMDCKGRIL